MTTPAAALPTARPTTRPVPQPQYQRLLELWRRHRGWLWTDVVSVFLITRLALVGVALFASFFPTNPGYPITSAAARGWHFTPVYLVDVWGRWDTGWYFDLIDHGYYVNGDVSTTPSNLGFYPLYPYLVKGLTALGPPALRSPGATLLMGVLVSNAFLLGGLVLVRQWVLHLLGDAAVARRTVLYLLLFPTAFFFSTFYTESTFLFFSVAALYAAQRRAWGWACLAGAALTLSRPLGILIVVPLAWQYAEAARWNLRHLRWDAAWFALLPAGLLAFFYWQYTLTGDFLATLHTRAAWSRTFSWPWGTLLNPQGVVGYITPLEQGLTLLFVGGALLALRRLPSLSLGLYALLLIAPPLFTGQLTSTARYYLAVAPVFVVLAQLGRHPTLDRAITIGAVTAQALLFFVWCLFYWVA